MIYGKVVLEDITIDFTAFEDSEGKCMVRYNVFNGITRETDSLVVPQADFFAALAIAVHDDGMPDYRADYPAAESVQPENPFLRFIP